MDHLTIVLTQESDKEHTFIAKSYKVLPSKKKLRIKVETDGTVENGTITITQKAESITEGATLFTSIEEGSVIQFETLTISNVNYKKNTDLEETLSTASTVAKVTISALTVLSFPGSAHVGLMLIKAIQIFDYMSFINVEQPSNLVSFLGAFSDNILNILPNPIAISEYEDDGDVSSEGSSSRRLQEDSPNRILLTVSEKKNKC